MAINLTKELQKVYVNQLGTSSQKIAQSYKKTFLEVQDQIGKMFLKLGSNPTMSEIVKFNRLSKLEEQLRTSIEKLNGEVVGKLGGEIKYVATGSYANTLEAIKKSNLGFDFNTVQLDPTGLKNFLNDRLWIDAMNNNTAKLWTDIKREYETVLRANSREEIISGVMQGKSYKDVMKSLQERFDVSEKRSKTIAFTEMHKAHSYGRVEGINLALKNAAELGVEARKVWAHNHVGKPRPDHLDADGLYADTFTGMFTVGGEELQAPGLGSDPSNNINCHCSAEFEVLEEKDIKTQDEEQTQEEQQQDQQPSVNEPQANMDSKTEQPADITNEQEQAQPQAPNEPISDLGSAVNTTFEQDVLEASKLFPDVLDDKYQNNIDMRLRPNFPKETANLSDTELKVLLGYTNSNYSALNKFLYNGKTIGEWEDVAQYKRSVEAYSRALQKVMDKLPTYTGEVMRTVDPDILPSIETLKSSIGKTLEWKGFASSGMKGSTFHSKGEERIAFVIKSKSGKVVNDLSLFSREKEVLFRPGSKFRIEKIKKPTLAQIRQEENYYTYVFLTEI